MLRTWIKKRILRDYLLKLPFLLKKRYGSNEYYSKGQVLRTIDEEGLSKRYQDYAIAMFLSDSEGIIFFGNTDSYQTYIQEIADLFFGGDMNYKMNIAKRRMVGNSGYDSSDAILHGIDT